MPHESTVDHNLEYNLVTDSPMATRNIPPDFKQKFSQLPSQKMARSTEITHTHDEDRDSDE